ncbi:MAG TPA: inorganic phosphate transporter [Nitriliruptoraceae bacterium]|nr:inorganic phosphate transporter [Nitriliruptoraceae bacterium]
MDLAWVVMAVAWVFAGVCGVNDGAAMLAAGLRVRGIAPWAAVAVVGVAVVVTPMVLGTAVASTLADKLVTFDGRSGSLALVAAVSAAVATTVALSSRGLPTSLTLALVGSIAGAGLGADFGVSWTTVGFVIAMGIAAPLVGMAGGWLLTLGAATLPPTSPLRRWLRPAHMVGFGLQCLAYGANDGQKMIAVVAVAAGVQATVADVGTGSMLAIGVVFMVGTVIGLPRMAATMGGGVVPLQPAAAVVTEVSSAGVVLASSALGAPVSMTQAIAGAMVGTNMTRRRGRIRWEEVGRLAGAWAVTLPVALALAWGLAWVLVNVVQ